MSPQVREALILAHFDPFLSLCPLLAGSAFLLDRTESFGYTGVMNPFTELREAAGLTLADLAAASYIDVRALSRVENGLYSNPLPNLVDYWVKRGQANYTDLEAAYYDYVDAQRTKAHRLFGDLGAYGKGNGLVHPFREMRAAVPVGLTECAKLLCVPLDTLQFFEKKWRLQQSVPKPLKAALNQIGYTGDEIKSFEDSYKKWRMRQLAHGVTFS